MTSFLKNLYENHHKKFRESDFSILKKERGEFFKDNIGVGKKVLDLGCRDGALTTYFLVGNDVYGTDIDSLALARARERGIKTIEMDLYGSWKELQKEKFDVILAGEVLEHLFYPHEIVEKVCSHLNPEGCFVGSVPNAFSLKNRLRLLMGSKKHTPLEDPTHVNHFSSRDIKKLLNTYFSDVRISGLGRYKNLANMSPEFFAFNLIFFARTKRK